MTFNGCVQGKEVLILIDSGSSNTFISSNLASQLQGISTLPHAVSVQVANGERLQCTSHISQAEWSIQGCTFKSDLRIIPLTHYDLIVGMDWMESFSPMQVNWKQKWMVIPYLGSKSLLQGLQSALPEEPVVEVCAVLDTDIASIQMNMPPALAAVLEEYAAVFEAPSGLPPPRECDHAIPLIDGATPINVKPYRYPPILKDEIERQIVKMLQEVIIQHSVSPFSSSVLLVRKKGQFMEVLCRLQTFECSH